jgi:hypothetical protein
MTLGYASYGRDMLISYMVSGPIQEYRCIQQHLCYG